MTTKHTIPGIVVLAAVMAVSMTGLAHATTEEMTDAELQDMLGNQIHELRYANEELAKLLPNSQVSKLIEENEAQIDLLVEQFEEVSHQGDLADISPVKELELTTNMWKMVATNYPFLSMGINPYTGGIDVMLDAKAPDNAAEVLQSIVGNDILLHVVVGTDDAALQGSCPNQTGRCDTIVGASKGEPDNIDDLDCTINMVATKGQGSAYKKGVIIPHHCNEGNDDYYQYDKNDESHLVGPHVTSGSWFCDCSFVEVESRPATENVINDDGSDILVTRGDLSANDGVYMIGQYSGKEYGTIVKTNQWKWLNGHLYTDLYYVTNIDFNVGDSGAPIVRTSDSKYGGMNIGAGTEFINWEWVQVNYVHDWTYLKSQLGLN